MFSSFRLRRKKQSSNWYCADLPSTPEKEEKPFQRKSDIVSFRVKTLRKFKSWRTFKCSTTRSTRSRSSDMPHEQQSSVKESRRNKEANCHEKLKALLLMISTLRDGRIKLNSVEECVPTCIMCDDTMNSNHAIDEGNDFSSHRTLETT